MITKIEQRPLYLDRIVPFMRKSVIKVLTGQRRVGKSYILLQLMEKIGLEDRKANIIYINREELSFDFMASYKELNDYVLSKRVPDVMNYLFIDEIQDIEGFEKALRSLLLDERMDIYITGSNAKMLSGELGTYLSGRYIEFPIYSLSYSEFLQFHKLEETEESFQRYLQYGGLPYLIHLPTDDKVISDYLKMIYTSIVFRDVVSRYGIRNSAFLEKLILFFANNIGSLFSAKSISDFLKAQNTKISPTQIIQYADNIASAFVIHKVGRYDMVGKRLFEFGEKFYFEDLGIRNAIAGYRVSDKGKLFENMVYNHLLIHNYEVTVGSMAGREIDFIAERSGEKLYVQVALRLDEPNTLEREFGNLLKIEDNYPKIVVSGDSFEGNSYEGIKHVPIRTFLRNKI